MMQDPRISKSIQMRKIFGEMSAEDLNDPDKLEALTEIADQYDMPEVKLWAADRALNIRAAIAKAKPDLLDRDEYVTPDGRVFRGATLNGVIVETLQDGTLVRAEQGSMKYTPTKKLSVRKVQPSQRKTILPQLVERGYDSGAMQLSSDELNLLINEIGSIANVKMAEAEAIGEPLEEYDAYDEAISQIEREGRLQKGELFGIKDTSSYTPRSAIKKPSASSVEQDEEVFQNSMNIEFDEDKGEQIGFTKNGVVVVVDKSGKIIRRTQIVLSPDEQQQLMQR
jgi:hypothetical protein